jgi:BirA family biotin operon repressor/biotin-[acetyl-CoA-carboxylase] ligase
MCAIFTGNRLIKLEEVNSTNVFLSDLTLKDELPDGTVVVAAHQFAGKGQRGNVWQSNKNQNLTFSILYYPVTKEVNKQFQLTQAISLGLHDYLIKKCKQVKIKWPNDLYISNKKIGGLLIENSIKGNNIAQTVIGVGLNINQVYFDLPNNKTTSLSIENAHIYNLENELKVLLSCIERRYLQWKNGLYSQLKKHYLEELYLFQSWHNYQTPEGNCFEGKIIGVNDQGQLLVEDLEANQRLYNNKEIAF